jgi:hypothetical protein
MQRSIIVTDLTRFSKKNNDIVCTAGIDPNTGECIRPMPYLQSAECKRLKILPGAILTGDFKPAPIRSGPHQEDSIYRALKFNGSCTSEQFKKVLADSCFSSLENGFEIELPLDQKYLPPKHPIQRSIITIKVSPSEIDIVEDSYKPEKIKLHFQDPSGRAFRYVSITDLGYHDYALHHREGNDLLALNQLLHAQDAVFLRIGLSRLYKDPNGREGYWLQANGIYTFPRWQKEIRSYTP